MKCYIILQVVTQLNQVNKMITIKQTNYYKDNLELFYGENKFKKLVNTIRKNTTVDLGGLVFGAISLVALLVGF